MSEWTVDNHHQLEEIDTQFKQLLLDAEQACAVPVEYPWSLKLHKASQVYNYWAVDLKGKKNKINVSTQQTKISQSLSMDIINQGCASRPILKQLQHARKHLIALQTSS
jgi:hypothetical protein